MKQVITPFLAVWACLIGACANKVSPSGGTQDTDPPKATFSMPENFSTGMTAKEVRIDFDEFIRLDNLQKQLVVSPPMDPMPEIQVRKRSLIIRFQQDLRPRTTYTINFGDAITDIRENNAIPGFKYVFSTGKFLDSLTLGGHVHAARDLEPQQGVTVMLYLVGAPDSLPGYFTRTDESGRFRFTHMAAGSYRVLALQDADSDYTHDEGENVAFADSAVSAADTVSLTLRMFRQPAASLRLAESRLAAPGLFRITFNEPYQNPGVHAMGMDEAPWSAEEYNATRDTLLLWFSDTTQDTLQVVCMNNGMPFDTVAIQAWRKTGKNLITTGPAVTSNIRGGMVPPAGRVLLYLTLPCLPPDTSLMMLTADSLPQEMPKISFTDKAKRQMAIDRIFGPDTAFTLTMLPGAITDFRGQAGTDTVRIRFRNRPDTDLGTLRVKLKDTTNVIVQLLTRESVVVEREARTDMNFDRLEPGGYRVRLIHDANGNGRWDTGDYTRKRQPEQVQYHPAEITIRANWDLEVDLDTGR